MYAADVRDVRCSRCTCTVGTLTGAEGFCADAEDVPWFVTYALRRELINKSKSKNELGVCVCARSTYMLCMLHAHAQDAPATDAHTHTRDPHPPGRHTVTPREGRTPRGPTNKTSQAQRAAFLSIPSTSPHADSSHAHDATTSVQ